MGHVPTGSVRQEGASDDLPRRQHRGTRTTGHRLTQRDTYDERIKLARFGERVAATFLERHGAKILDRNVVIGRGEIDLLATIHGSPIAVEVRTVGPRAQAVDPILRIDDDKLDQVRTLANRWLAASGRSAGHIRIDFVGVRCRPDGVEINWRTAVA